MHFLIVIYTACKSLAKWWGLFLGLMCCLCVVCMRILYTKLDRLVSKSFTCLLIKPKVKDSRTNRSCPSPVRSKQQCLAGILQHLVPPTSIWKGAEVSPHWNWWGERIPHGITNIFKKSHLCQFVMDSKDLYICRSAKTYTILQNSGHLEFPRKHAAILDFVCFWTFLKKYFPPSRASLHNLCYIF